MNDGTTTTEQQVPQTNDVYWVWDVNRTEETIIQTQDGKIHVIHEITFGDVIVSTVIMALLIFLVIDRIVRRFS